MIAQPDKRTPERDMSHTSKYSVVTRTKVTRILIIATLVFLISLSCYCWIALNYLPPRTFIANVPVGLTTRTQALTRLRDQAPPLPPTIRFTVDESNATSSAVVSAEQLNLRYDPESAVAVFIQPTTTPIERIKSFSRKLFSINKIDLPILYNESVVHDALTQLAHENDRPGRDPSVTLKTSGVVGSVVVDSGELGFALDTTASARLVEQQLQARRNDVKLPMRQIGRVLSEPEVMTVEDRARALVGKRIDATAERLQLSVTDKQIISLIDPPNNWNLPALESLVSDWQKQTGTQPQEPELEYDPTTLKVSKFTPPRHGRTIQLEPTKALLLAGLDELQQKPEAKVVTKELALAETPPTTSLASLNTLGLNERIGFGESYYAHSIPNRIHNVAITARRIDNTIIPPGTEFSFNKTLGDVSAETGYKSAYVIKNGKTELGDGGGVCQVSTTVFRAVLNAGLAVTKRLPHSYRVSYYELDRKPGMDATVYAGDVDFRFKNDTPGHILLHTVTDDKNTYMYAELYGTSDGRHTEIVDHKTWDARPAPPAQYFPDPTLPVGKLVQIDWSAPGIRTSFTNVIYDKNNQEIRRDTYTSNYKPWSAKYLQGVAP